MSVLDLFKLEGKTAIVTGGARGLGKEMAKGLAEAGADVVIVGRNFERAQQTAEELKRLNVNSMAIKTDVTKLDEVRQMVTKVVDEWGKIDILVNNAGVYLNAPAEEMTEKQWDEVIDVHLKGAFLCSSEVGKKMIRQGGGVIINISSQAGFIVTRPQHELAYHAAKGGLIMLTKGLAAEWAKYNIRVNAIAPGFMDTEKVHEFIEKNSDFAEIWKKSIPMGRLGQPKEIAGIAVYLASDASSFMTGSIIILDGGYTLW
jgi:NAD(P)-dependent dehydrogenase (short-subunit alcohol dehydrogenase family)